MDMKVKQVKPHSFAYCIGNLVELIAEVISYMGHRASITAEAYNAFRDAVHYGGDPKKAIEDFMEESIHVAMSKPIEKMTKAELEAEYDFVTGEEKVFVSITHARSAVQALIDRGELWTKEKYDAYVKSLPTVKPPPAPPPEMTKFLGNITGPQPTEEEVRGEELDTAGFGLKAQDFRDIKGRIQGKYTKKALAAKAAGKPLPEKKAEKPKADLKALSGHVIEILSLEDIGAGDKLSEIMAQIETLGAQDHVVKENGLDASKYVTYPNLGVRKMRITNSLRALIRRGTGVVIAGITLKLTAEALEAGKKKRR